MLFTKVKYQKSIFYKSDESVDFLTSRFKTGERVVTFTKEFVLFYKTEKVLRHQMCLQIRFLPFRPKSQIKTVYKYIEKKHKQRNRSTVSILKD